MERTGFMEKKKKAVLVLGFLGMLMTVAFMLVRYISIARPIQEAQYDYALENRGLTCQIDNVEIDGKGVAVQGWIYLLEEEPEEVRYYVWLKETDSDHCVILHTQCETRVDLADSAIDELDHSMGGFRAAIGSRYLDLEHKTYEVILQYACDSRNYLVPTGVYLGKEIVGLWEE